MAPAVRARRETAGQMGCRWGDLNSQGRTATRPSTVRVYQFRHTDVCVEGEYSGRAGVVRAARLTLRRRRRGSTLMSA